MKKLVIGVDIDGVLANFNYSYAKILTKHTGIEFPDFRNAHPDTWYWDRAAGVEKNRENVAWCEIKNDQNFWLLLDAYGGAERFIRNLNEMSLNGHDVYFITNRMGVQCKWQTELWLENLGFEAPTVLISRWKGYAARALDLTHYIDDKTENCVDVKHDSGAKVFMLARPYNHRVFMVDRLDTLDEFTKVLEQAEREE